MKNKIPLKLGTLVARKYNRGKEEYKEIGIIINQGKKWLDWGREEIEYKIKLINKNPNRFAEFAYVEHPTLVQFWNVYE